MEAIEIAEAEGFNVVAVVSLVDREEGGSEKLGEKYNYHAIFTARELLQENERAVRAHIKSPRTCAPNKSILIFQSLVFQKNSTLYKAELIKSTGMQ
jgi:orotate phosphoribosyltransferase